MSNHGGRQVDGCVPTAVALREVAAAVGGRVPVLVDGGIRDGADVLRALALGAGAVLIGRPYAWGLATGGEAGVRSVVDAFAEDFARALALAGCPTVAAIDGRRVRPTGVVTDVLRANCGKRLDGRGRSLHVGNLFWT